MAAKRDVFEQIMNFTLSKEYAIEKRLIELLDNYRFKNVKQRGEK